MTQPLSSPELGASELTPLSLQEADKMLTEHFNLIVKGAKIRPWGNTFLIIEGGVARIPTYVGTRRIQDEVDADAAARGIIEEKGFDFSNPEKKNFFMDSYSYPSGPNKFSVFPLTLRFQSPEQCILPKSQTAQRILRQKEMLLAGRKQQYGGFIGLVILPLFLLPARDGDGRL